MNSASHDVHAATLHRVTSEDAASVHRLFNLEDVSRHLWDGEPVPRATVDGIVDESAALFREHGFGLWVLKDAEAALIGVAGLWHFRPRRDLELIFAVDPAHAGQGIATRLATTVTDDAFRRLRFDVVLASCDSDHAASKRVLEKAGFEQTGARDEAGIPTTFYERDGGATVPYMPRAFAFAEV